MHHVSVKKRERERERACDGGGGRLAAVGWRRAACARPLAPGRLRRAACAGPLAPGRLRRAAGLEFYCSRNSSLKQIVGPLLPLGRGGG